MVQLDVEGIGGVKYSGFFDGDLLSVAGINPPVSDLIGMGKGITGDLPANVHVIKSGLGYPQAALGISQAFAVGKPNAMQRYRRVQQEKLITLRLPI